MGTFLLAGLVGAVTVVANAQPSYPYKATGLLFTYEDGLRRRALVGSVLALVAPDRTVTVLLVDAIGIAWLMAFVAASALLIAVVAGRSGGNAGVMALGMMLLASAHTRMLAIDVARTDVLLVIVTIVGSLILLRWPRAGSLAVPLLATVAVAIHELAVFATVPVLLAMLLVRARPENPTLDASVQFRSGPVAASIVATVLVAVTAVLLPTPSPATYRAALSAASVRADFEVSESAFAVQVATTRDSLGVVLDHLRDEGPIALVLLLMAMLPATVLTFRATRSAPIPALLVGSRRWTVPAVPLLLLAALAPLVLIAVGVDHGRFTTLAVINLIIVALWVNGIASAGPAASEATATPWLDARDPVTLALLLLAIVLPAPARGTAVGMGFEPDFTIFADVLRAALAP